MGSKGEQGGGGGGGGDEESRDTGGKAWRGGLARGGERKVGKERGTGGGDTGQWGKRSRNMFGGKRICRYSTRGVKKGDGGRMKKREREESSRGKEEG